MDKATKDEANRLGNLGDATGNMLVNIIGAIEEIERRLGYGSADTVSETLGDVEQEAAVSETDFLELREFVSHIHETLEKLSSFYDAPASKVEVEVTAPKKVNLNGGATGTKSNKKETK